MQCIGPDVISNFPNMRKNLFYKMFKVAGMTLDNIMLGQSLFCFALPIKV